LADEADVVVTMGCGDECPYIPGKRYIDWDLPDPAGRPLDEVRSIRDDIARRVRDLVAELDQDERERLESERDRSAYAERGGHRQDPPELRKPPNEGGLL
jgi:hypothetical protein